MEIEKLEKFFLANEIEIIKKPQRLRSIKKKIFFKAFKMICFWQQKIIVDGIVWRWNERNSKNTDNKYLFVEVFVSFF